MASRVVPLSAEVSALRQVTLEDDAPIGGIITQLLIHWPPGCAGNVEVAIGIRRDTWLMPPKVGTYLALDDFTAVLDCYEPIERGERLWMVIRNGDDTNAHVLTSAFNVVERPHE